jgi:hypothetical protein
MAFSEVRSPLVKRSAQSTISCGPANYSLGSHSDFIVNSSRIHREFITFGYTRQQSDLPAESSVDLLSPATNKRAFTWLLAAPEQPEKTREKGASQWREQGLKWCLT